jgi:hypothetical protein
MTAKAHSIAKDIASNLKLRQSGLAVTESIDSDQLPLVRIGTGVAGTAGALIKVVPQDWPLAKDILGLTALQFGPHKIQVVVEANPSGGAGADINTWAQKLPILGEVLLRGCRVEIYESANTNAPGPEDIVAGNLKATFDPHPQFGMIANQ